MEHDSEAGPVDRPLFERLHLGDDIGRPARRPGGNPARSRPSRELVRAEVRLTNVQDVGPIKRRCPKCGGALIEAVYGDDRKRVVTCSRCNRPPNSCMCTAILLTLDDYQ